MSDKEQLAQDLVEIFAVEAREHMEEIEKTVMDLDLEKDVSQLIDMIFRSIHSVKGGAFATNLLNIGKVGHAIETILDLIREKKVKASQEIVDLLLEGTDLITKMLNDQDSYGEKLDVTSIYKRFTEFVPDENKETMDLDDEDIKEGYEIFGVGTSSSEEKKPAVKPITYLAEERSLGPSGFEGSHPPAREYQTHHDDEGGAVDTAVRSSAAASAAMAQAASQSTIRIRVDVLDQLMRLAGELVLIRNQQVRIVDRSNPIARAATQRLDTITTEIQNHIMSTRMQPLRNVLSKIPRMVRDLSRKLEKGIDIFIKGDEVELDKTILESLSNPLLHIVRNCCDHGIESEEERVSKGKPARGKIEVSAFHEGGLINIKIIDDGKGIPPSRLRETAVSKGLKTMQEVSAMSDAEALNLIFLPGFSTAEKVTDISGRGVGMDVVKTGVEKLGGSIELVSKINIGTELTLHLPLTLAIIPCLILRCLERKFAIPQVNLIELVGLDRENMRKVETAGNREIFRIRDRLLPIVRLEEILMRKKPLDESDYAEIITKHHSGGSGTIQASATNKMVYLAVLRAGARWFGVIVDNITGTEEVVISPMHSSLKQLHIYSGATIMGDGQVALILDIIGLSEFAGINKLELGAGFAKESKAKRDDAQSLLLFKLGENERFAIRKTDIKRVEHIHVNKVQMIGDHPFAILDGVPTFLIYLDKFFSVSPRRLGEEFFLILPKSASKQTGIVCSELIDIGDFQVDKAGLEIKWDGIEGSILVDDTITLLLDIPKLMDIADSKIRNIAA